MGRREPNGETTAVTVDKSTMSGMLPLPMTTGIPLKVLAAGVSREGQRHRTEETAALQQAFSCLHLQQAQAPESKLVSNETGSESYQVNGPRKITPVLRSVDDVGQTNNCFAFKDSNFD